MGCPAVAEAKRRAGPLALYVRPDPMYTSLMSNTTFMAYIPVVPSSPQPTSPAALPTRVDDFHPGVIAVLLGLVIGMVVLSRGGR